jgi:hypothetical protein
MRRVRPELRVEGNFHFRTSKRISKLWKGK